ncbi:MAG: hypothetical protein JO327_12280, partial [Nitrososphaeraceae archaeon]|nr:hypothetical protein [Nitrososphaeraceae archaeon]
WTLWPIVGIVINFDSNNNSDNTNNYNYKERSCFNFQIHSSILLLSIPSLVLISSSSSLLYTFLYSKKSYAEEDIQEITEEGYTEFNKQKKESPKRDKGKLE